MCVSPESRLARPASLLYPLSERENVARVLAHPCSSRAQAVQAGVLVTTDKNRFIWRIFLAISSVNRLLYTHTDR